MSARRRLPNPVLTALHPGVLPGGVGRILLVGHWSAAAEDILATLRRRFPDASITVLAPKLVHPTGSSVEAWEGNLTDPVMIARARRARFDLIFPIEPYGLMGETQPEFERFALAVGARAVAVYEATYGTVRVATRAHLRYRLYFRKLAWRAFGVATVVFLMVPLYIVYTVARWGGIWRVVQANPPFRRRPPSPWNGTRNEGN